MDYYIYQATKSDNSDVKKIGTVTDTLTYTVTGLKPNTTYYFSVTAWNGLRESAKSTLLTVATSAIPVTGLTLSLDKTALEVGDTGALTLTVTPTNQTSGTPTIASSDTKVATISGKTVTAVGVGTTKITATLGTVTSTAITVTVYEALKSIKTLTKGAVTTTSIVLNWTTA
ncbi:Ig-like domain-containing protein [Lapidilactobacillus luobeiensis]|uniref:Ig-like domain-containing protein n=1 Tax=Lapidilactobacillus luobeiensis TaxID=2950371 RepID=UPI0035A24A68